MIYNKDKIASTHTKKQIVIEQTGEMGSKKVTTSTQWSKTAKIVATALIALSALVLLLAIVSPSTLASLFSWNLTATIAMGMITLVALGILLYHLYRHCTNQNGTQNQANTPTSQNNQSSTVSSTRAKSTPQKQSLPQNGSSPNTATQKGSLSLELELQAAEDRVVQAERNRELAYKSVQKSKKNDPQAQVIEELKQALKVKHPELNTVDMDMVGKAADLEVQAAKDARFALIKQLKQANTQ